MPIIGEMKTAKEIGIKWSSKYIFAPCEICGKGRWVQFIKGKANPRQKRCKSCGASERNKRRIYSDTEKLKKSGIKCRQCNKVYPASPDYFLRSPSNRIGLHMICKKCKNKHQRERLLEQGKIKYHKTFLTPQQRRLRKRMSESIRCSILFGKNGCHWESLVDYSLKDLMKHLEKQFTEGMSWDNYGRNHRNNNPPTWSIDHIIPTSAFNFDTPDDIDFKRCWALSNLRPLWGSENSRKEAKISKPFQLSLKTK